STATANPPVRRSPRKTPTSARSPATALTFARSVTGKSAARRAAAAGVVARTTLGAGGPSPGGDAWTTLRNGIDPLPAARAASGTASNLTGKRVAPAPRRG